MNSSHSSAHNKAPPGALLKRWWVWILPLTLLGVVYFVSQIYFARKPSDLSVIAAVPEWEQTNQAARPFGSRDLRGKVYLAHFVFSRCPSVCPGMLKHMESVQLRLQGMDGVALVTFTVDPEFDTPTVLSKVASDYKADPLRWNFVTGTDKEALFVLYRDGFKINVAPSVPAEDLFDIAHSEKMVLVDQLGQIRGYYSHDKEQLEQLLFDMRYLLENPPTAP